MSIGDMQRLNGWLRAGMAVSLLWILVSTTAYWTSLGVHIVGEGAIVDVVPGFVKAWWLFCMESGFDLFGVISSADFKWVTLKFNAIGFITFVLIPVAVLWGIGFLVAWVVAGFKMHK